MADSRFFRVAGPFSVAEIAALTGAELGGAANGALRLSDVAPIETAGPGELTSLHNAKYLDLLSRSEAGAAFVAPGMEGRAPAGMTLLVIRNPYLAYAKAAQAFYPVPAVKPGIADTAVVEPG